MYLKILDLQNMDLETCELDPAHFLTAPRLAWEAALKNTIEKFDFLTDIHMFLMVEKCIRGGICYSVYRYVKAHNKYIKD